MQTPSLGRILLYHFVKGTKPDNTLNVIDVAAIVTKVHEPIDDVQLVDLHVFDSSDRVLEGGRSPEMYRVQLTETLGSANTCSWPPFVPQGVPKPNAEALAFMAGAKEPEKTEPETEGAKVVEGSTVEGAGAPSTVVP